MKYEVTLEPLNPAGKPAGSKLTFRRAHGGDGFVELFIEPAPASPPGGAKPGVAQSAGVLHVEELMLAVEALIKFARG